MNTNLNSKHYADKEEEENLEPVSALSSTHTHTLTIYYSLSSSQGRAMDMGNKESKNAVYLSRMDDQSMTIASNYIFGLLQFNYLHLWCVLETLNFKMIED